MVWKLSTTYSGALVGIVGIAVLVAGALAWRFAPFIAPFSWTGEPTRLAQVLGVRPGLSIADIGAGDGALALEMASLVGREGQVYATELAPDRLAAITRRVERASVRNVRPVAATEGTTGLPARCCDVIYMRTVFHHIDDTPPFISSVVHALRPGARVGVIDFEPGALWFHGADHGVRASDVVAAFQAEGLRLRARLDDWGGGMFLLVFERDAE